jgi:hypothetical protein
MDVFPMLGGDLPGDREIGEDSGCGFGECVEVLPEPFLGVDLVDALDLEGGRIIGVLFPSGEQ